MRLFQRKVPKYETKALTMDAPTNNDADAQGGLGIGDGSSLEKRSADREELDGAASS